MVAVLIPIFISVLVTVSSVASVCTVQDERHVPVLLLGVEPLNSRQHAAVEQSGTDNEQGDIRQLVDDGGVGHDFHRRAVDEDVVIFLAQVVYQLLQPFCEQQFGGVGWYHAYGDDVQLAVLRFADDFFPGTRLSDKVIGDAFLRSTHILAERAFAQVEVDGNYLLSLDGEAGGEVERDECLAAARIGRGEHDDI